MNRPTRLAANTAWRNSGGTILTATLTDLRHWRFEIDFENIAIGVMDAKYKKFDIQLVLERLLRSADGVLQPVALRLLSLAAALFQTAVVCVADEPLLLVTGLRLDADTLCLDLGRRCGSPCGSCSRSRA